jgi:hypothetical protein
VFRFGLKNLRRLADVPAAELRPITILVGRNSSGKSTFLRALPLLRQSITTRTSSPILWFGNWVDFGDFDRSVKDNDAELPISFTFGLDVAKKYYGFPVDEANWYYPYANEVEYTDLEFTAWVVKAKVGTRISEILLRESENKVEFRAEVSDQSTVKSLKIDGVEMIDSFPNWTMQISPGAIFPSIRLVPKTVATASKPSVLLRWDSEPLKDKVGQLIGPSLDKRTKGASLRRLVDLLFSLDIVSKDSIKSLASRSPNSSWKKLVLDIGGLDRRDLYAKIRSLLLVDVFVDMMDATTRELTALISSILYIGPARAKSDRYYRYQDLSVSEIDPDGQNFPMFLNSLTDSQIDKFSSWVKSLFGYGVKVGRESGHITINLVYEKSTVNIVDTGYGISQILPVLGQVWWANNKPRRGFSKPSTPRPLVLAIEQPELHLHPAHQALLADAFVSGLQLEGPGTKSPNESTHFVVETHSETMINRLGALIAEKKIAPDKIQILVFNADDSDGSYTSVHQVIFDEKGHLINWPYDFFIPNV